MRLLRLAFLMSLSVGWRDVVESYQCGLYDAKGELISFPAVLMPGTYYMRACWDRFGRCWVHNVAVDKVVRLARY